MTRVRRVEGVERETELIARWAAGEWREATLLASDGQQYRVVYEGRRGGGAGPDFRDAVLACTDGARLHGDVELHLRAANWRAHGHERDPRYDGVVLHVVLAGAAHGAATRLSSGATVPLATITVASALRRPPASRWPCSDLYRRRGPEGVRALLLDAGAARFAARAAAFATQLATRAAAAEPPALWSPADRLVWGALAEALGYGRDREALRAAGTLLAEGKALADVSERLAALGRLDRRRLEGLLVLRERFWRPGPWTSLHQVLSAGLPQAAARGLCAALAVPGGAISPGRAAILAANVVLPFAAAWGTQTDDAALSRRAREAFSALHGLPSNAITRTMARQLGLPRLPAGAQAQQGLHHVWATHCREKRCVGCPCASAP
jgi:hypothetical protein